MEPSTLYFIGAHNIPNANMNEDSPSLSVNFTSPGKLPHLFAYSVRLTISPVVWHVVWCRVLGSLHSGWRGLSQVSVGKACSWAPGRMQDSSSLQALALGRTHGNGDALTLLLKPSRVTLVPHHLLHGTFQLMTPELTGIFLKVSFIWGWFLKSCKSRQNSM